MVKQEVYAKPGELIQGMLPDKQHFLVSNKSSLYFKNTITLSLKSSAYSKQAIEPLPDKCTKAIKLFFSFPEIKSLNLTADSLNIIQETNIPIGKGLSSSSTDILGILMALSQYFNYPLMKNELYHHACSIEPTDPCMDKSNVIFNQRTGDVLKILPHLAYKIIYFDSEPERIIDTIAMQQKINYSLHQQGVFKEISELIPIAFDNQDYPLFYDCLKKSALINETFLPKKRLSLLMDFAQHNNCGIFIAHTGTYMGLVFYKEINEVMEAKKFIEKNWNSKMYFE